jgi:glycosyltransferase involved in cell wall biosynthesis
MVVEAVESVLTQEFRDFELIAIDDGSTDETENRLSAYGSQLHYHRQHHVGVSGARNCGIELSSAPLVAFLDSDDLWLPKKLGIQWGFMDNHPEVLICQTEEIWLRNGRRVNPGKHQRKPSGDIFRRSLDLCLVSPSAVMMRRELLDRVGCFDEALLAAEDYDLWLRVAVHHSVPLIPEALVIKRGGHPDQLSRGPAIDRYRIRALEKLLVSGKLSAKQYEWTWQTLKRKCEIYGQGCRKRDRVEEGERFLQLPERYREKTDISRQRAADSLTRKSKLDTKH